MALTTAIGLPIMRGEGTVGMEVTTGAAMAAIGIIKRGRG
jgi:hypothetical protein